MKMCLKLSFVFCCLALLLLDGHGNWGVDGAVSLERYNIESGSVTVSGISSGGAMSTQFHFIHSAEVHGAAVVAGVPYCCGVGGLAAATTCMSTPALVNVNFLISEAQSLERNNYIDRLSNVAGDRVYIWHGSADSTVRPASGTNVQEFYQHFGANVRAEFGYAAEHGWPTDNFGAACGASSANFDYFNNCNYKGAYQLLNWLYGQSLALPSGGEGSMANLLEFNQSEFFALHPSFSSMDTVGFVYVPTACRAGASCKLHISFHGCAQSRGNIGNSYPVNSGFMDVAEVNNIVVLFPQIVATAPNLAACWDWFGYLNNYFCTKDGNQILATYRMLKRITG